MRRCSGGAPQPPLTEPPTLKAVNKRARRAERKADRRLTEAIEAGDDALLHRARKAAKRARYAAELRVPVDKRAKKTVKHYKRIQTVLGDHQDGVVASRRAAQAGDHRRNDRRARTASPTACCTPASNRPPRPRARQVRELVG